MLKKIVMSAFETYQRVINRTSSLKFSLVFLFGAVYCVIMAVITSILLNPVWNHLDDFSIGALVLYWLLCVVVFSVMLGSCIYENDRRSYRVKHKDEFYENIFRYKSVIERVDIKRAMPEDVWVEV